MHRLSIHRIALVLVFLCSLICSSLFAQTQLTRISKTERSDGLGYVVRFHFTQPVDSFALLQPAPDLIQMELYGSNIDTTGIDLPSESGKIQDVHLFKLDESYGADIYLDPSISVKANAYLDQNGSDILVALTKASEYEVEVHTQQFLARNWYLNLSPADTILPELAPVDPDENFNEVKDKLRFDKVVIDAGHGGHDPGNIGYRGVREKDVVLSIARRLGNYIEELLPGVDVIYTRDDDSFVELEERGRIANRSEADLFVSIHADAWHSRSVNGASVFFLGLHRSDKSFEVMKEENQVFGTHGLMEDFSEEDLLRFELAHSGIIATSERIAYMVEDQIKNRAMRKSRGVKQMGLVVLYQSTMPAILVETGFLTNPRDQRYLTSEQGQIYMASAIFRAIKQYKQEFEAAQEISATN